MGTGAYLSRLQARGRYASWKSPHSISSHCSLSPLMRHKSANHHITCGTAGLDSEQGFILFLKSVLLLVLSCKLQTTSRVTADLNVQIVCSSFLKYLGFYSLQIMIQGLLVCCWHKRLPAASRQTAPCLMRLVLLISEVKGIFP